MDLVSDCPKYRIRIFLSVDLVGSTAFKADTTPQLAELNPTWVDKFKSFYQQFPKLLGAKFRESSSCREDGIGEEDGPKIWKIIGDEIIFCCRVLTLKHLSCCTKSFLSALEDYGFVLESDPVTANLDVKGAGWVAAFPGNISLAIDDGNIRSTLEGEENITEAFEVDADANPHRYDFLGPTVDAGFRTSKNASADRFSLSVELAYLLANAAELNMFSDRFHYAGRQVLKGVTQDRPYPIIAIERQRDPHKREVSARERMLTRQPDLEPVALKDFLRVFLSQGKMDVPVLPIGPGSVHVPPPSSYEVFKRAWEVSDEGVRRQKENESEAAGKAEEPDAPQLKGAIKEFAKMYRSDQSRSLLRQIMDEAIKTRQTYNDALEILRREITEGSATKDDTDVQGEG